MAKSIDGKEVKKSLGVNFNKPLTINKPRNPN